MDKALHRGNTADGLTFSHSYTCSSSSSYYHHHYYQDLVTNLGTVAKSGTSSFVEALASGNGDLSQIGKQELVVVVVVVVAVVEELSC